MPITKQEAREAVIKYKESLEKERIARAEKLQERLNKSVKAIDLIKSRIRGINASNYSKLKKRKAKEKLVRVYSELKRRELLSEFGSHPKTSIFVPINEPIKRKPLNHKMNFLGRE